jgi:hypothetical protein
LCQSDPQSRAACSEVEQLRKFKKVHPRSIGAPKKLKRGIVNPQASAPFGNRVNGHVQ